MQLDPSLLQAYLFKHPLIDATKLSGSPHNVALRKLQLEDEAIQFLYHFLLYREQTVTLKTNNFVALVETAKTTKIHTVSSEFLPAVIWQGLEWGSSGLIDRKAIEERLWSKVQNKVEQREQYSIQEITLEEILNIPLKKTGVKKDPALLKQQRQTIAEQPFFKAWQAEFERAELNQVLNQASYSLAKPRL